MVSKYRASIYNFFFNSFNSVIMIVNGIIMVPLYFEYISLSTYGAWLGSGNIVTMLGLLEAGFASVITQKMAASVANENDVVFRKLAGANIISAVIISLTIFILGLSLSPFIASWVNTPHDEAAVITKAYILALCASSISILVSLFGAFPQVWQDTKSVGTISILANIVSILSLVVFLLWGWGILAIPLSYLVRACFNFMCQGIWILGKWKRLRLAKPIYEVKVLTDVMKTCILPFLSRTSGMIMAHSQSFLIAAFVSPTMSAIYDLTCKITQCIGSFLSSINGSFFALFSITLNKGEKDETDRVFNNVSKFFVLTLVSAMLFSLVFTKSIMNYWVGLQKYGGMLLLVMIILSAYANLSKSYFNNLLYCGGLINRSAKYDIYCMALYLLLIGISIRLIGVYAIPLSLLLSNMSFLCFYLKMLRQRLCLDTGKTVGFMKRSSLLALVFAIPAVAVNILTDNIPLIMVLCATMYMSYSMVVFRKVKYMTKI